MRSENESISRTHSLFYQYKQLFPFVHYINRDFPLKYSIRNLSYLQTTWNKCRFVDSMNRHFHGSTIRIENETNWLCAQSKCWIVFLLPRQGETRITTVKFSPPKRRKKVSSIFLRHGSIVKSLVKEKNRRLIFVSICIRCDGMWNKEKCRCKTTQNVSVFISNSRTRIKSYYDEVVTWNINATLSYNNHKNCNFFLFWIVQQHLDES